MFFRLLLIDFYTCQFNEPVKIFTNSITIVYHNDPFQKNKLAQNYF